MKQLSITTQTICNSDENIENVKSHLVSMTKIAIDLFERNCMQANPEKFQAIFLAPGQKKVQTDFSIERNGLNMAVCNLIFWSVVVPTTIFGYEVWVLDDNDLVNINDFQKLAGRRIQRFESNSPTYSCYYGLGWMDLFTYICIKKLIFLHTIVRLEDDSMVKMLSRSRAKTFNENIGTGLQNAHKSPLFEIFKVSHNFGLYDDVMRMIFGVAVYSKSQWRDKIWKVADIGYTMQFSIGMKIFSSRPP